MKRTCILVYNLNSSKKLSKKILDELVNYISSLGYIPKLLISENEHNVKENIFKDNRYTSDDIIISIGGDGTFSKLLSSTVGSDIGLAHIPNGTTNDIGKMFGISSKKPNDILYSVLTGDKVEIDIPQINGTPFAYIAGTGKFLDIPYNTSFKSKAKFGHLAYLKEGTKNFFKEDVKPIEYICKTNEGTLSGHAAIVSISNSRRIAGVNNLFYDAYINDNLFEICMLKVNNRSELLNAMIYAGMNKIKDYPKFFTFKTNYANFHFNEDLPFDVDGDLYDGYTKNTEITLSKRYVYLPKKRKPDLIK